MVMRIKCPEGPYTSPCLGCGYFFKDVRKHIRVREQGRLACTHCELRGFTCTKDNLDIVSIYNALGIVYTYKPAEGDRQSNLVLCTGFGNPEELREEERDEVIEIDNPLYDFQLASNFPCEFQDVFPQNPKKVWVLSRKKDVLERLQWDMREHPSQNSLHCSRARLETRQICSDVCTEKMNAHVNLRDLRPQNNVNDACGNDLVNLSHSIQFEVLETMNNRLNRLEHSVLAILSNGRSVDHRLDKLELLMSTIIDSKGLRDLPRETRDEGKENVPNHVKGKPYLTPNPKDAIPFSAESIVKELLKNNIENLIMRLLVNAMTSTQGFVVTFRNMDKGFFGQLALDLVNKNFELFPKILDPDNLAILVDAVIEMLVTDSLPGLFATNVRQPIISAFKGYLESTRSYWNLFQGVSIDDIHANIEYRHQDGDPYGREQYRNLLEAVAHALYPKSNILQNEIIPARGALGCFTVNSLAFIELLMIYALSGGTQNLERRVCSKRGIQLYSEIRSNMASRTSMYLELLRVQEYENFVQKPGE